MINFSKMEKRAKDAEEILKQVLPKIAELETKINILLERLGNEKQEKEETETGA